MHKLRYIKKICKFQIEQVLKYSTTNYPNASFCFSIVSCFSDSTDPEVWCGRKGLVYSIHESNGNTWFKQKYQRPNHTKRQWHLELQLSQWYITIAEIPPHFRCMKHYKLWDEQPADVGSQPSNGDLSIIHLCHFLNKHGRNKNIKMLHTFLWKSWESRFTTQIQTTSGGQRPQHIGTFLWAEPLSHKDLLWSVNKTLDLGLGGTRCTSATHTYVYINTYIYTEKTYI